MINRITRFRQFVELHHALFKQNWAIWLVGFITFLNGSWSIASILLTRLPQRVQYFLPFGVYHWNRSLTLVLGFILVYLSLHLLQRRRTAWWVAIFAVAIGVVAHLLHLRTWYTAIPQATTLILLLVLRGSFTVRSESRNIKLGFVLLFGSLLVALLYGTFGFWMLAKNDFGITFSLQDGLVRSLRQFLLLGNPDIHAATRQAGWFLQSLDIMGIVAASFATYSLFRPIVYRLIEFPIERSRATAILEKHGNSTFDYFKVWPDKSYYFSPSRQSFIAYRMVNGVAFCLADPVGPIEDREAVIQNFLKFCTENGWMAAVMFPDDPANYTKYGFSLFRVGEEAVVDLEHFAVRALDTPHFRRVIRKFDKERYTFIRYRPPIPAQVLDEAQQISRQWLTLPHHREYGFFQGHFDRGYMENCTLSVLGDKNGVMIAFINEVPSYRPGEAYFDLMRYVPGSHWGTMDYLFAQMMLTLKNEGYHTFNFAIAPFVGMANRPDATLAEKTVNQIFERLDWFLHSKGIRQYKLKFQPQWRDVFIAYQGGPMGLLRVALNVNRIL